MILNIDHIKGRHRGEDAYVIGSGASLDYYPASFFDNRLTIGLNDIGARIYCQYILTVHHEFFPEILQYGGTFVVSRYMHALREKKDPAFYHLDKHPLDHYYFTHPENGFGEIAYPGDQHQFAIAGTSVVPALELCRWLDVDTVFLCGIDAIALGEKTNYDGYGDEDGDALIKLEGGYNQHLDQTRHLYHDLIDSWHGIGPKVVGVNPFLDFYEIPR